MLMTAEPHLTTQDDPAAINIMESFLRSTGLDGCHLTEESDAELSRTEEFLRVEVKLIGSFDGSHLL